MTFLTIITRCCRRPKQLRKNIESVLKQTSDDWEQLFLVDPTGRHKEDPVQWANRQFERYADLVRGEYVYALDDDGLLIEPTFVETVQRRAVNGADVILVKMRTFNLDEKWTEHPLPSIWKVDWEHGHRPQSWIGNGFCVVVKRDVWREHIEQYQYAPGGDWHFITSLVEDPGVTFARLNMVVSSSPGRGCGVIIEKCADDWFHSVAQQYDLEPVRDWAWRLTR